jgi:hypothetical protein
MKQRSVLGWVLLGTLVASVSCSGDSKGTGPVGFGVACKSDKDCASYEMLCGDNDTCVQCLDESNCKPTDSCSAGLCKTPDPCKTTGDCSGSQVCQTTYGLCVDCNTSKDCARGEICRQNKCGDPKACDFTSDCSDGLLCDATKHLCVTCRTDNDCGFKQTCEDGDCVTDMPTGGKGGSGGTSGTGGKASGGTGGKASGGTGGKATAGTESGGTEAGGTESGGVSGSGGAGGKGGNGGNGGKAGNGGNAGSGGSSGCECSGGDACTPDLRCVPPTLIDDLLDCNDLILPIQGRKGNWAAAADSGVNISHGFTDPGSGWSDHTCAAWATGGELTQNGPNTTFAFIGFRLNVNNLDEGLAYSLASYNGLQIKLESSSSVQVVLKTTGGGYFQVTLAPIAGSNVRTAPFASMLKMSNSLENAPVNLSTVYEVQFSVLDPKSFGLAIHKVSLY